MRWTRRRRVRVTAVRAQPMKRGGRPRGIGAVVVSRMHRVQPSYLRRWRWATWVGIRAVRSTRWRRASQPSWISVVRIAAAIGGRIMRVNRWSRRRHSDKDSGGKCTNNEGGKQTSRRPPTRLGRRKRACLPLAPRTFFWICVFFEPSAHANGNAATNRSRSRVLPPVYNLSAVYSSNDRTHTAWRPWLSK